MKQLNMSIVVNNITMKRTLIIMMAVVSILTATTMSAQKVLSDTTNSYQKRIIISKKGAVLFDTTIYVKDYNLLKFDTLTKYFITLDKDTNIYRNIWNGIDFGFNCAGNQILGTTFNAQDKYMKNDIGRSFNFKLNLLENVFANNKKAVSFVSGLGYERSTHSFANPNISLQKDQIGSLIPQYDSSLQYNRNKLINHYINVPLLVRFAIGNTQNKNKAMLVALGVIGSYRFSGHQSIHYVQGGITNKVDRFDNFNQTAFALKGTVRIAYRFIRIFAETSLIPVFQKNQAPQTYFLTAGISLVH